MTTLPAPLQPGDLGLDAAAPTFSYEDAVRQGARFFVRYGAGAGDSSSATAWKLCKVGEIGSIVAAGGDFVANDEWTATRMLGGAAAGAQDGSAALKFWQSRGLARGATIIVSADFAASVSQYPTLAAYANAYARGLLGYYDTIVRGGGVYGGTGLLKYLLGGRAIGVGWRPAAGSWSNDGIPYQPNTRTAAARAALVAFMLPRTPAAIAQTGNTWYGGNADEDVVLRVPIGTHCDALRATPPPAPPAPQLGYAAATTPARAAWVAASFVRAALHGGDSGPVTAAQFPEIVPPPGQGINPRLAAHDAALASLEARVATVEAALKPPTFTAEGETK